MNDRARDKADHEMVDRSDDAAAFEELVRCHYASVWRVVHRIVRRERESEEVVQEIFLKARAVLPEHRGGVDFDAWLRRLAVEHAVGAVKPGHRRKPKLERRRLSNRTDSERERRLLESGLSALCGSQRAPLALNLEGLGYAAMARELDVSIVTVRNRLSIARDYLSRCTESREESHGS